MFLLALVALTILVSSASGTWERHLEPKLFIEEYPHQLVRIFQDGNASAGSGEYLRLLLLDGVLVGGRSYLYNLIVHTPDQVGIISWLASGSGASECTDKPASSTADPKCANHTRVARHLSLQSILVCGTNAYSPSSREYHGAQRNYSWKTDVDGSAACPPDRNSGAALVVVNSGQIAGLWAHVSHPKRSAELTARPLRTRPEGTGNIGVGAMCWSVRLR